MKTEESAKNLTWALHRCLPSLLLSYSSRPIEGGVVGDDDRYVDGGEDDDDVPQTFDVPVMRKYKLGLLGYGGLIFRQWLYVMGG